MSCFFFFVVVVVVVVVLNIVLVFKWEFPLVRHNIAQVQYVLAEELTRSAVAVV